MKKPIGEWPYQRGQTLGFHLVDSAHLRRFIDDSLHIDEHADCCLFVRGTVVFAGGAIQSMGGMFPHVAEAAFFHALAARLAVPDIYYAARDLIRMAVEKRGYTRVQCHVAADDPTQIAWAERLGFVHEGRLLRMGLDSTDMSIMRWEG